MARLRPFVAAVILVSALTSAPAEAGAPDPLVRGPGGRGEVVPGEVVVAVESGADAGDLARRAAGPDAAVVRGVPERPDVVVVKAAPGSEAAVAARLRRTGGVRWATPNAIVRALTAPDSPAKAVPAPDSPEQAPAALDSPPQALAAPDGTVRAQAAPNDPLYPYQWNLRQRGRAGVGANWAPLAGTGVDGRGVTVAVLDSGVTANDDLDGVLPGYDFVDDDARATDGNGHGTHVAGTIAQTVGNRVGVAGIAPGASILPVRVLDANGSGTIAGLVAGLAYATNRGARVVNLSLGGAVDGGVCRAIAETAARGVVVIAAAGNDGGRVNYPGACPWAFGIAATTSAGTRAAYSSRGPEVDMAAPGGDTVDRNGDGYGDAILQRSSFGGRLGTYFLSGTSSAAPHVSGAAALVLQREPRASVARVRQVLAASAVDLGPPGRDADFGVGLLDVAAAVRRTVPPRGSGALTGT